ncbi:hypothetical protein R1flu_025105 [Riccia fluitans]|uniref:Uncharacterized protein n=1 Tax=Riccia fluitans TaxID=41844 RepID=A0ABD1XXQ1_9MARC
MLPCSEHSSSRGWILRIHRVRIAVQPAQPFRLRVLVCRSISSACHYFSSRRVFEDSQLQFIRRFILVRLPDQDIDIVVDPVSFQTFEVQLVQSDHLDFRVGGCGARPEIRRIPRLCVNLGRNLSHASAPLELATDQSVRRQFRLVAAHSSEVMRDLANTGRFSRESAPQECSGLYRQHAR